MASWTIDFKTRANRLISIVIDGKSGNTDVALTPSDNPCSIEEEGREDLFMPIKTQSGYIEVVTDDIDFATEIIPTEGGIRNVYIYETSITQTLIWAGYVQPKLLDFKLWNGNQVLRIPIECKLSGLRYRQISLPSTNEVSIGMILYKMLNGIFIFTYFQGGIVVKRPDNAGDDTRAWIRKKVYSTLFNSDMTWYDVLENLCTFFGWTARQYKSSIYFVANRNVDAPNTFTCRVDTSSLFLESHISTSWPWKEVLLSGNMLTNNSNRAKFIEGLRTAKASCSLVTFDQDEKVDFKEIGIAVDNGTISPINNKEVTHYSQNQHYYEEVHYNHWTDFGNGTPITIGDFTIQGSNVQPVLEKNGSTDTNEWNTKLSVWYTSDYLADTYEYYDPDISMNVENTDITKYQEYYGSLKLTTVNPMTFSAKGTLVVNTNGVACFYIKISNLWYNPTENVWQQNKPTSYIKIEADNKDGYSIPIPQAMTGELLIEFVPDSDFISKFSTSMTEWNYALESVYLEYTAEQSETYNSQISNVEYTASNNGGFSKEVSFDSLICIRGELAAKSKNFLMEPDGNICEGLYETPFADSAQFIPLQRLCNQAVEEMSQIGKMYEIKARWRDGIYRDISPFTMIYVEPLSEWCYPVSVNYNLRDDEVLIRLIKRTYSEGNQ